MNKKEISLEESFSAAINFHTKGKINEARKIYEEILESYPDHLLTLTNLGIVFSQLKDFKKAVELFSKVIKINPKYAEGHNNLGNSFFELSEIDKALESYKKAVQINYNFSDAYNNLGNVYQKKNDLNKAIENYELAISIGTSSMKDKPYYNLGNIHRELGNFEKSIALYKKAIDINPNSASTYMNLSISLNKNGNLEEAISTCEKAIERNSKNITALNNLGEYNHEIGKEESSIEFYKKALKLEPKNLRSKWLMMNTFPIIYKNSDQINYYKNHFDENLKSLEELLKKINLFKKEEVISALNSSSNFYLHYQGSDITNLQKRYASLLHKLSKYIYPQFHKKIDYIKPLNFLKIGFVSSFFFEHVISKLFKNWVIKINKNKFKTFVYYTGIDNDKTTNLIKKNCFNFFHETNINSVINKIISDKLDILVFLDIGMDPKLQIMSPLRLAPVQCSAYGVPVTTGIENIDFFLTGEAMETDDSYNHYSEKLVKLPDLGVYYEEPQKISLNEFNKKKNYETTNFISLQSNFKLLPQHDHIYFDIIKKNPKSKFTFISTKNKFIAEKFKERLNKISKDEGLIFKDFFVFYPQTSYQNYLNLIYKSDIVLDSLDWSGLNTSLEAISLDKPIITLPSNFMRGRHTYGVLKILKTDELICSSKKEYIDLAVKLSTDLEFKENIVKKININKKLLFDNYKTIQSLENFFLSLGKN